MRPFWINKLAISGQRLGLARELVPGGIAVTFYWLEADGP